MSESVASSRPPAVVVDPSFDARKDVVLTTLSRTNYSDRSPKGSVDSRCYPVMEYLNGEVDYVTTSSCSGRVSLWQDAGEDAGCEGAPDRDEEAEAAADAAAQEGEATTAATSGGASKKKSGGGGWLYVSHDLPELAEVERVFEAADLSRGVVWVKFEPYILHVQARTLEASTVLLKAGLAAGFRNSGIVVGGSAERPSYIVAFRHTAKLDCPLAGGDLGGECAAATVRWCVAKGRKMLEATWARADTLLEHFRKAVEGHRAALEASAAQEDPREKWRRRNDEGLRRQEEARARRVAEEEAAKAGGEAGEDELAEYCLEF
eukprot:Rhum_TRINITY_DN9396_c1_g3::Rhum_TRINITY_DN9396_c1_g3_i1::g.33247::m.33247/K15450/TYW3; tRNA wybutosine-synthesizing protein 3